jgi:hypothetical protein
VRWSCARQNALVPHAVHLLFLLLTVGFALLAWSEWRDAVVVGREDAAFATRNFLALVAVAGAGFSALVILALWIPQWMIAPCIG